jgi:arylsulfatase A-like enzyme
MVLTSIALLIATQPMGVRSADADRPNVLFIAVDDLNDWVGFLQGHPQVKTPQMDRLAARGLVFANAHCAAPLCNPSRAAIFSGRQPWESGVFNNDDGDIRQRQPEWVLLPTHFQRAGYVTFGTGKLLHQKGTGLFDDAFFPEQRWSPFDPNEVKYTPQELPSKGTDRPRHAMELNGRPIVLPFNGLPSDRAPSTAAGESFDWGPVEVTDEQMGDGQIARWGADKLRRKHDQPFFLAVGFYRPHIPLFAPRKYFDLYDGIEIALPPVKDDDLDDLGPTGRKWATEAVTAGAHDTVVKHQEWQSAVKAYLACVSFIDAQVGLLLDALESGPHASNTIVVLWGDHGWHLGEKQHWGKWTGWQRATRVPLVIALPERAAPGARPARTTAPVSLLDLYPTLIELCGLPPREQLAGKSLVPLLRDPQGHSERTVISTFDRGNHAVMDSRWRYIRYADGSQELYDCQSDPHEWTNLAGEPEHQSRMREMSRQLPPVNDSPCESFNPQPQVLKLRYSISNGPERIGLVGFASSVDSHAPGRDPIGCPAGR